MHHPMYPISHDSDIYEKIQKRWEPLFVENHIDLGFCGHQHVFMRTAKEKDVTYIMSRAGEKYSRYYEQGDEIPGYIDKLNFS